MKSLLNFYSKLNLQWKEVLKTKAKNPRDQYRCEYFATLIC